YYRERNQHGFDLKKFVKGNFYLPQEGTRRYVSDTESGLRHHIKDLSFMLRRTARADTVKYTSLLPLPNPFIIPGSRFREIYYWDSYFILLGLKENSDTFMIENMVRNFAWLIRKYGFVPNGNRSYYLTRSQPPYFSLMVDLLAEIEGAKAYQTYLPQLVREYLWWMKGEDSIKPGEALNHVVNIDGTILNRYWDYSEGPREESYKEDIDSAAHTTQPPQQFFRNVRAAAESGWDFSSRWFADGHSFATIHTTEIIPVDLNCLLYHLEETIANAYNLTGDTAAAKVYRQKAENRRQAILKYCWNEKDGFYTDYCFTSHALSHALTIAGLYPLFFKIATPEQADLVQQKVRDKFLCAGGVVTSLKDSGQQWDWPNGWAPMQYITITGLDNYGYNSLAKQIAVNWVNLNVSVFKDTGKLLEKYNVENINLPGGGGEYPLQDGFGWTNGVLLKLMDKYKIGD
ncbi:MAG TPA: alpha,alpha-trehalase TreF, partial [Chitinophagales bacterium]|nr:alpha,alpha-trehalase TreF [Chitinophagales bacterium]